MIYIPRQLRGLEMLHRNLVIKEIRTHVLIQVSYVDTYMKVSKHGPTDLTVTGPIWNAPVYWLGGENYIQADGVRLT